MFDVAIIGAGITGCSIARELSRYKLSIVLVDKSYDVCNGSSKANSAIVHGGYDPKPSTLMAKFNVEGNRVIEGLCRELSVPFKRIGALIVAFDDADLKTLEMLLKRGIENGVPELKILTAQETIDIDPNINKNIKGALFSGTTGIVSPYELTIALAENAAVNEVKINLNTEVLNIEKKDGIFELFTNKGEISTKTVVNAAGVFADRINNLVSNDRFEIKPRKGQYMILNRSTGNLVKHVIFQCPSQKGKGILVTPTVYGNTLIGPDSEQIFDKEDVSTDKNALEFIQRTASKSVENIPFNKTIKTFAGLRAESDRKDFIVEEAPDCLGFFNAAGIKSPGLTSAPALALYMACMILNKLPAQKKNNFINHRESPLLRYKNESEKERALSSSDSYKKIICRCEQITEGEILDAISREPLATTRDGVKRRARAGMGTCQGNHCGQLIRSILGNSK
ncbi:MAG TPA: FAD/NAD(P)-binding oxidoreductase [Lentisphaeria bacterium]|nr:MAG: hypothetical protein A2X47_12855 [Lentisphaerae bacterium GWF2_38_69]HBM14733.1 FAD/NAD(P)-binding oxidoreductase [Lentisphaeria bacterium]